MLNALVAQHFHCGQGDLQFLIGGDDQHGDAALRRGNGARAGLAGAVFLLVQRNAKGFQPCADLGAHDIVVFADAGGKDQSVRLAFQQHQIRAQGLFDAAHQQGQSQGGGFKQIIPNARWEEMLTIMRNTPGFGNDIDEIDKYAVRCGEIYCEQVEKYTNARGGKFQAGMYPVSANVLYGKDVMALPTGRLAKTPIADGVSPRAGYDTHGPTAAANSVSKLDHALASNGTLYNMKFLPSALAGDKGIKNMASLIRSYFERKGMHVQFNVVDRNTLIDAQNNPDKHKDLVIRVAGYSAHFTKLAKETQDNIIARTEMEF